jgi:alcohol dehydrogenase class IV
MPANVRIGRNAFETIHDEIAKLAPKTIILVSDKGLERAGVVQRVAGELSRHSVPIKTYTEIYAEPEFDTVQETIRFIAENQGDLVIGIGGGSALDVAKASAALANKDEAAISRILAGSAVPESRGLKCILVPTTSGTGSEVTMNAIFGDTTNNVKRGIVSPYYLPDLAIIDPVLTVSCPPLVSAASGVDAFTHAIESYVSTKATPLTRMYAEKAMKLFAKNITKAVFNGTDLDARENMSWVSFLAGVSLANAGVGAVHALAYPLGGKYHVPHGVANALLLPYVFEVTGKTCIDEMVDIAGFLYLGDYQDKPHQALDAVTGYLYSLLKQLNLPSTLKELQVKEEDLAIMAEDASKIDRLLNNTPYKLNKDGILRIYQKAYAGQ